MASAVTLVHRPDVAGLAAVRTIKLAVHAEPDAVLPLANRAITVAVAVFFGFVANHANHWACHATLRGG